MAELSENSCAFWCRPQGRPTEFSEKILGWCNPPAPACTGSGGCEQPPRHPTPHPPAASRKAREAGEMRDLRFTKAQLQRLGGRP